MYKRLAIIAALLCFYSSPLFAASESDLDQTKKDMEAAKARQAEIAEQTGKVDGELKDLQKKLVTIAGDVQQNEKDLSAAEEKLRILNEQVTNKNSELAAHRKNLATLVQAALHLSRIPPEAIVMMPGDATQTMEAASALKMASDSIRQETESIGAQIIELQELKDKVTKNHDELAGKRTELTKERESLKSKLTQRKTLREKLGNQQQQEVEKIALLAKKADNLQELLNSLSSHRREHFGTELNAGAPVPRQQSASQPAQANKKGTIRSFVAAKGHIRPPVSGKVVQSFGAEDGHTTSKGISISVRTSAAVTAPYDGEVVFTGPFLAYGQLVIIRHSDDFYTLLAGLTKIDVDVGQFLLEGEPIGAMGEGDDNKLYVELRKNNQPVDPGPWIQGLNKK